MKVAVTGHTSGIGKGIYDYFANQPGYEVFGYSRSNGYELPYCHDSILAEIEKCDIFVNNSRPVESQIFLLKNLWPSWKDQNKKIIVIGSIAAHLQFQAGPSGSNYQRLKKELNDLCKELNYSTRFKNNCKVISFDPGWVDTPGFRRFNMGNSNPDDVMSVTQFVSMFDYVINAPIPVNEISFRL